MSADPLEIHRRLMAQLPVRTHQLSDTPAEAQDKRQSPRKSWAERKAVAVKRLGSGGANRQAVIIRGARYKSLTEAALRLRMHRTTIKRWIAEGIAHLEAK